jgi:Zn-dependent peptidase ImmA (M78 family)
MEKVRRGFKTWCENASHGYRRELKLTSDSPLDPRTLAKHLGVEVWIPAKIDGLEAEYITRLIETEKDAWSAVTLRSGNSGLIIINNGQSPKRQNNSLAHELSHVILKHEPAKMFQTNDGLMLMTDYNQVHEQEAIILAGALLVPREALLKKTLEGMSTEQLALYFDVSNELIVMRTNTTGIKFQLGKRQRGTWVP